MLTFFTTAKPFRGHAAIIQRNALQSWKLLHPAVEIILFGGDEGAAEVCRELGLRHQPGIIVNPSGTKRLDSIFGQAQQIASRELLCYCNCDIVFTSDFSSALEELRKWRERFLMIGRRWDTDFAAPIDFSRDDWEHEIVALARSAGFQRAYHNIDYFLFPRGLYAQIPPLVIGRVGWDPWLVGEAHALGVPVVDVSDRVCAVHQNHDYGYHPQGITGVWNDQEVQRNIELTRGTRLMTIEDAPWRLTSAGVVKNPFYWLAPAKRRWRDFDNTVRGGFRTYLWHPLLNFTRPLRRVLGLRQSALPDALRNSKRRHHPMDR
ncbi:MAG TPA: hypothetical protein VFN26_20150 [Candidatus Acidoferrum sp.]|nr:hypothetical protein [Candidatus Acidoferrum sp.]